MRCRYCGEGAGWWRRRCRDCERLLAIALERRGQDMVSIADALHASGATADKIERFLDADPDGAGCMRDQIAADAANQLLEGLGSRKRQTAQDMARLRARGAWRSMDQRPEE